MTDLREALATIASAMGQATVDEEGVIRYGPHTREGMLALAGEIRDETATSWWATWRPWPVAGTTASDGQS